MFNHRGASGLSAGGVRKDCTSQRLVLRRKSAGPGLVRWLIGKGACCQPQPPEFESLEPTQEKERSRPHIVLWPPPVHCGTPDPHIHTLTTYISREEQV